MEYRKLGDSGLLASAVGLGTNNIGGRLDEAASRAVVNEALGQGVTFIDTADVYSRGESEATLGKLLAGRRQDVVVATKFGIPMSDSPYERGASRQWIVREIEASLRRLRTDYIDLYQVHRPDPETPLEETLRALDDLVGAGKVRYVGTSNFDGWQIADADWTARTEHLTRPISAQLHYNLLHRDIEAEAIPACRAFGVGLIPYFPLESGLLTGKYGPGREGRGRLAESARAGQLLTPENFAKLDRLEAFAHERGHGLLDLAFAWLLAEPIVGSVIASASTPEQVRANVAAAQWRLSPEERGAVPAL